MTPVRVLVCIGTRPEAIKLFPVVLALRADPRFVVRVCATAQHRDMLDQVLRMAGIVPDIDLDLMRPGQSAGDTTIGVLAGLAGVLSEAPADWLVVQGDTTTAMAASLAAFQHGVAVAHVEAGLRSGDMAAPFPEEANRRITSLLARLHFAPTARARAALLAEGVPEARVLLTGNTVVDALLEGRARSRADPQATAALRAALPPADDPRRIILVTAHRRENLEHGIAGVARALLALAARGDCCIAFPVHPNPAVTAPVQALLSGQRHILLLPPLDYLEFIHLLDRCHLVLTDSGGVQEEAPSFGKPVLVLRAVTERPEAIEAGTARLVGTGEAEILAEASRLLEDDNAYAAMAGARNPFGDGQAAARIREALAVACP